MTIIGTTIQRALPKNPATINPRLCPPGFLGGLFQTPLYHLRPVGELSPACYPQAASILVINYARIIALPIQI